MAETRASILRAARPIMLRDGLGGTTLDRVATEGGIAKMTLYRHFPSKEALFEGLVTATCESMREGLENAPIADTDNSVVNDQASRSTGNTDYNDVSASMSHPCRPPTGNSDQYVHRKIRQD